MSKERSIPPVQRTIPHPDRDDCIVQVSVAFPSRRQRRGTLGDDRRSPGGRRSGNAPDDVVYPAPRCPSAEITGGINVANVFPVSGKGVDIQIVTPANTVSGDIALLYWKSGLGQSLVDSIPLNPTEGHAQTISVPRTLIQRLNPADTRGTVEVWYTIRVSDFGDENESERLSLVVDLQPPGGFVFPDHQASFNPDLEPIPELQQAIPPGVSLTMHIPPWKRMAPGDRLYVRWGSHFFQPVTITQAGFPVPFVVPWSIISNTDDGQAIVSYYILDTLENDSLPSRGQARVLSIDGPTTLQAGSTATFTASGGVGNYTFDARDRNVATFRPGTGTCDALMAGTTTITVSDDSGGSASTTLVVTAAPEALTLIGNTSMQVNDTQTFTASGGTRPYTFASSTPFVASIDRNSGSCEALNVGQTTISVSDAAGGGDSKVLIVHAATQPLKISGPTHLQVGASDTFSATGGTGNRHFTSDDTRVATIGPVTGACDAVTAGTTNITVRDEAGGSDSIMLTVTGTPPPTWDQTFDFDGEAIRDISSEPPYQQLQFPNVFYWFFNRNALPSKEQFIGVQVAKETAPDMSSGRVLRIGHDQYTTLISKNVLCQFWKTWARVRFAITAIDDPVTVDFYEDLGSSFSDTWTSLGRWTSKPSQRNQEVLFDAPAGKKIKWIRIQCVDTIYLDFFQMRANPISNDGSDESGTQRTRDSRRLVDEFVEAFRHMLEKRLGR